MAEAWLDLETLQARNACTPDVAARLNEIWYETDVQGVLGAVQCPTLLLVHEERTKNVEEAEFIASSMPDARVRLMPGLAWTKEELPLWAEEVREFAGIPRPPICIHDDACNRHVHRHRRIDGATGGDG